MRIVYNLSPIDFEESQVAVGSFSFTHWIDGIFTNLKVLAILTNVHKSVEAIFRAEVKCSATKAPDV